MQFAALLVLALATSPAAVLVNSSSKLDINQKVYIENAPVLGDSAGETNLGGCHPFAPDHVANSDGPAVKVCGTGITMTIYLRNRCEPYFDHSREIGKCDKGAAASTCDTLTPAEDKEMSAYQSYRIVQC
mmetsp:Transcript_36416/g.71998  ORF Transcript_36416/g.71998 Transcript_36416/m.71998 type:complete len:130 (+) Transcript_36416:72-461(+)